MRKVNLVLKRIFDFLCSLIGILVLSPLILILALCIKLTSKGPVFFLQERMGYRGKAFRIIKFRTMVVNAEKLGTGIYIKNDKEDSRVTKIGRILRATSLDELPQLFNVLAGQMSLVGPRPPVTYHPYDGYENYPDWAKKRFDMKPGITGLAQVVVRNTATWDERMHIDGYYVDHFNILWDIRILFLTVKCVFTADDINGVSEKLRKELCGSVEQK